jgi:polar amino acid transport system substrate-binding protein
MDGLKRSLSQLLAVPLLCCGAGPVCADEARVRLRLVHGESYAPFSEQSKATGGELRGLLPAIAEAVFAACPQVQLVQEAYPWSRAQAMLQSGEADAIISVLTDARRATLDVSKTPMVSPRMLAFVSKGHARLGELHGAHSLSDLRPFRIGTYSGSGWARENLRGYSVDMSTTKPDAVFQMLARSRFDLTIENSIVAGYHLRRLGLSQQIKPLEDVDLGRLESRLMVRRGFPGTQAVMSCFEREMAALRGSARWRSLWRDAGLDPGDE